MPKRDPILEEIRAVRERLAREADYDLEKLVEAARARQAARGVKTVSLPARRIPPAKKVS